MRCICDFFCGMLRRCLVSYPSVLDSLTAGGKTGEKQPASEELLSQTFQSSRSIKHDRRVLGQEAQHSAEVQEKALEERSTVHLAELSISKALKCWAWLIRLLLNPEIRFKLVDIQADLHPICPLKPLRAPNMIRAYPDNWKPVLDKLRLKVRITFFYCIVLCFAFLNSSIPSGGEMWTNRAGD